MRQQLKPVTEPLPEELESNKNIWGNYQCKISMMFITVVSKEISVTQPKGFPQLSHQCIQIMLGNLSANTGLRNR